MIRTALFVALLVGSAIAQTCPSGSVIDPFFNGVFCVVLDRPNRYLHVAQCLANSGGVDVITRMIADNDAGTDACGADPNRHNVEQATLDLFDHVNNNEIVYEICQANDLTSIITRVAGTQFGVWGNNPCDGDIDRRPIPVSGETPHYLSLIGSEPLFIHWNLCSGQGVGDFASRLLVDSNGYQENICDGTRQPIEWGTWDVTQTYTYPCAQGDTRPGC